MNCRERFKDMNDYSNYTHSLAVVKLEHCTRWFIPWFYSYPCSDIPRGSKGWRTPTLLTFSDFFQGVLLRPLILFQIPCNNRGPIYCQTIV